MNETKHLKAGSSGDVMMKEVNSFPAKVAYISSFLPRQCGLATFTGDVVSAVCDRAPDFTPIVVAMEEPGGEDRQHPDIVKFRVPQHDREAYQRAAEYLNKSGAKVVCIQHEFGLFGGEAGEYILELIAQLNMPVVTVMHTVLAQPEPHYRRVTLDLIKASHRIIVLTNTARDLMRQVYNAPAKKLGVIYHGVPDVPFMPTDAPKADLGLSGRTVLSTFGLINKGKGIEYAIEALPPVVAKHPDLLYLVLGGTHPVVRKHEGESYREALQARVRELGLENNVRFENRYLDFDDLVRYLAATDIYVTPYLGRDQIVSGTLAYALGFGKAIISTPYLYAEEALADGRGILVDCKDSTGITGALQSLLDNPVQMAQMRQAAYAYGNKMAWPFIGDQYGRVFRQLASLPLPQNVLAPATSSLLVPASKAVTAA